MSASSLPIFRLPSLVTEDIVKNMGPLELFCLFTLSARSKRFVKAHSSRPSLNVGIEIDTKNQLELRETLSNSPEFKIEFRTGSSNGLARLHGANTVQLCSKDIAKDIPTMLKDLCIIFKINLIDAHFPEIGEPIKHNILDVVKKMKLRIGHYKDLINEYSFEDFKLLVGSQLLWLRHPKLTDTEMKMIFKMCIEKDESSNITFQCENTRELFGEVVKMLKDKPGVYINQPKRELELTQGNGRFVSATIQYSWIFMIRRTANN